MNPSDLKFFLDEKADYYNRPDFIESDPISIPHRYARKEDIEISGFLSAMISWGNRTNIINNGRRLMLLLDDQPYLFIRDAGERDLRHFKSFVHRTFNESDLLFFIESLRNIYKNYGGLESSFADGLKGGEKDILNAILNFRAVFLSVMHLPRSEKHIANPAAGSTAKRINMFLRWMVRQDDRGVDFGIWQRILPSQLCCPLDVHSGRIARQLGLLQRSQNDWKSVIELTENLRKFDPEDPVKYDFALFGLGVNSKL
ncbi:MAG TPA: TIGR02757 family protein [Lentimicrobium sp.]|nr:TIGR02757 family protein [Lentimicrobium sp.]